ncbi:MAG: DUF262 domain-containing protein [Planctomycetes bacterium]|nr:DUF262 domain-containing protein [Planctomycetota bacterium]
MKVRAIDKQIHEIFASNYYIIPRFQHPYSWDHDNISEFWNDTIVETNLDDDYFIGSIVVYENNGYKGIVDGQQRITTIIILLCALRDVFKELKLKDYSEGVQNLIERANIDNKKQFVLSTESSFPYFQEKILKFEKSDYESEVGSEEQNIANAYKVFKDKLDQILASIRGNPSDSEDAKMLKISTSLLDIRKKILNLKIIFVELDNEDEAYLIFETLNTRGKELTVTDLLRNFITKNLHSENVDSDTTKLKWKKILANLNESPVEIDTDTFFLHQWISKYTYISRKLLFKEIKKNIKGNEVENYLNLLVSDSLNYRSIYDISKREWKKEENEIVDSLKAYQIFNVKQHMPVVLSAFRSYLRGNIKLKTFKNIILSMEKFHFIFTAITSSPSTGGMAQMYSHYAIRLEKENDTNEIGKIINEFIVKLKTKLPSIDEVMIKFKELTYTENNTKTKNLIKYILTKYDRHLRNNSIIDYNNMSIEHLYPQNAPVKFEGTIVGQIGNLFLVDYKFNNEQLRNKSYEEKKKLLQRASYPLDELMLNSNDINEDVVKERTEYIAKTAYEQIWKM